MVENLRTQEFIDCLKRFGARRGFPRVIYSDNAKTFVKAGKTLSEMNQFLKEHFEKPEIKNFVSMHGIEWKFYPTYSPFRNGLAEAAIGSLKYYLKRSIGMHCLSNFEMYTLLTQVEQILNSRPLTVMTERDTENFILTPNHLIYGHSLNSVPFNTDDGKITLSPRRYHLVRKQLNEIWKFWTKNYLTALQERNKWRISYPNAEIGDLAILIEDSPPPLWKIGIITNTYPDISGKIRTVKLKTFSGEVIRPIQKLCLFPKNDSTID